MKDIYLKVYYVTLFVKNEKIVFQKTIFQNVFLSYTDSGEDISNTSTPF